MSTELHSANIDREVEILKNVLRDLLSVLIFVDTKDTAAHRTLLSDLRDEMDSIFPPPLHCPYCGKSGAQYEIKKHVKYCTQAPRPRGRENQSRQCPQMENENMKVGKPQAERREVDYVRLENVPEAGIDVVFNGVVRAADKGEEKDYFIQLAFPDNKTRELGIDETTINHTNLIMDLGGEDTDKWKKGSVIHLSRGTVKNGKYAGNPFISVSVK